MKGDISRQEQEAVREAKPVIPPEDKTDAGPCAQEKSDKTLVFLVDRRKKKIDHTITTPDKYVSRYHYDSKGLNKYLELCPHCRNPSLNAYRKTVTDTALNYLEARLERRIRRSNLKLLAGLMTAGLAFSAGLYYVVFHLMSGVRF